MSQEDQRAACRVSSGAGALYLEQQGLKRFSGATACDRPLPG